MQFEARDLKPYAETVPSSDLAVGTTYFSVDFLDRSAHVPQLEPIVFIGRDLREGDAGWVYFQDFGSFHRGVRFPDVGERPSAKYTRSPAAATINVHAFESALNELLACSLRRRGLADGP